MTDVRCFVAVELERPTVARLGHVADEVRDSAPPWVGEKWVTPDNLHLTVRFLGNLPEVALPMLAEDLAQALRTVQGFDLRAQRLAARPSASRCRLLCVEFEDSAGRFASLAGRVETVALAYGVRAERRPPHPHVTLARARRPKNLPADALRAGSELLVHPESISVSVVCATLLTSTLQHTGPVYERVAVSPLASVRDD